MQNENQKSSIPANEGALYEESFKYREVEGELSFHKDLRTVTLPIRTFHSHISRRSLILVQQNYIIIT